MVFLPFNKHSLSSTFFRRINIMPEPYNFFNGSQEDINRRLLRKIEELEERVEALENAE